MRCIVLDSSCIFHLRDLSVLLSLGDKYFITQQILDELRDPRAQAVIDIIKPEVMQIDRREIERIKAEHPDLSDADCSIIVCVKKLCQSSTCTEIVVFTDDMKLRSILKRIGVKVETVYFGRKKASVTSKS